MSDPVAPRHPRRPLGRPAGSSAEETVARIIEAAQTQFGEHGYAGARMTAIASRAGITHSSIYQYFASKHELYQAAFGAAQAELLPAYQDAIRSASGLHDQIAAILRASVQAYRRCPNLTPFLASVPVDLKLHPDLRASLVDSGQTMTTEITEMFDAARERGEIPPDVDDLDLMVAVIGAAVGIGLISHGVGGDMGAPVEILLAGLRGTFTSPPRHEATNG